MLSSAYPPSTFIRWSSASIRRSWDFLFLPAAASWLREAPYVRQAANDLKVHLGWAVQVYNAAEALPNLINPFWMLPMLGVLGLKARDIVGFTFLQLMVHAPL